MSQRHVKLHHKARVDGSVELRMRTREMKRLLDSTAQLTPVQRAVLLARLQLVDEATRAAEVVQQRVAARPVCPHCGGIRIVRNGQAHGLQRFKCRGCGASFNALTGTPLARLRYRDRWRAHCQALQDAVSVRKAAAQLGVHRTTAFRWRHRFLQTPSGIKDLAMAGVVEADETYVLESFKGQRQAVLAAGRAARHRGGKARKRGLSNEQIPIVVLRSRTAQTADFVMTPPLRKAAVVPLLGAALATDAVVVCSDGSGLLQAAASELHIEHQPVNASQGQRVRGAWHVQNVNSYHSRLKRWLRRFNGVATSYLPSYLGWFRAMDRQGNPTGSPEWLLALAVGITGHHH